MAGRLAGKVCIITGTGGSMGRAAALTFAREGARLVDLAVSEFGRIDVLYNLAARSHLHSFEGFTDQEWNAARQGEVDLVFPPLSRASRPPGRRSAWPERAARPDHRHRAARSGRHRKPAARRDHPHGHIAGPDHSQTPSPATGTGPRQPS